MNSIFLIEDNSVIKEVIFAKKVADNVLCINLQKNKAEEKLSFIKSLYNYKKIEAKVFLMSFKDFLKSGEQNIFISKSEFLFDVNDITSTDILTFYSLQSNTIKDAILFVERLLEERVSEIELSKIRNLTLDFN